MSQWSVRRFHQKVEDRKLHEAEARVGKESTAIQQVKDKLRALPEYKDSDEDTLSREAQDLTTKEGIVCLFSHLYNDIAGDVSGIADDLKAFPDGDIECTKELATARERAVDRFDRTARLRVKLLLSPLRNLKKAGVFVAKLTQLYGPMHAALIVGDMKISWDNSSLVIPTRIDPKGGHVAALEASISHGGQWGDRIRREAPAMVAATGSTMDYDTQMNLIVDMATDKAKLIHQLAEIIVKYNKSYYYRTFGRNCQSFVQEAMKALEIKNPPPLGGKMNEYYQHLRSRKTVPSSFSNHAELDAYISGELSGLKVKEDMEYLLCLYFNFHKKAKKLQQEEQGDWVCESGDECKMGAVVERLEAMGSSVLDRFLANAVSASSGATP